METVGDEARELAFRVHDNLLISLLWWKSDNRLAVAVADRLSGESLQVPVRDERPLDVFHHPYAHAAWQGLF